MKRSKPLEEIMAAADTFAPVPPDLLEEASRAVATVPTIRHKTETVEYKGRDRNRIHSPMDFRLLRAVLNLSAQLENTNRGKLTPREGGLIIQSYSMLPWKEYSGALPDPVLRQKSYFVIYRGLVEQNGFREGRIQALEIIIEAFKSRSAPLVAPDQLFGYSESGSE